MVFRGHSSRKFPSRRKAAAWDQYQENVELEAYRKAGEQKRLAGDARAAGKPLLVYCKGSQREVVRGLSIDPDGKLMAELFGYEGKQPLGEMQFFDYRFKGKKSRWTLENDTPAIRGKVAGLLQTLRLKKRIWKKQAEAYKLEQEQRDQQRKEWERSH